MAFTGKSILKKTPSANPAQSGSLKANPYPGNNPVYYPCPDCERSGQKERRVMTPEGPVLEDDDCELCVGLGWVAK